jgi:diguanylate cyclase (GGDEF)-like protein
MLIKNAHNNDADQPHVDTVKVLHIENDNNDIDLLSSQLENNTHITCNLETISAQKSSLQSLSQHEYDVIFLSLSEEKKSLITLQDIRSINNNTPIIVISDSLDKKHANSYFANGAQDYILKTDLTQKIIERSIRYALERKKTEDKFKKITHLDPLTKLCNRSVFLEHLYYSLDRLYDKDDIHAAILLLDIDNFKFINESLGHNIGDALLIQIANRIQNCIRGTDLLARLGNDEFTIIFDGLEDLHTISKLADKISHTLSEPFLIDNETIEITVSIGVSTSLDEKHITVDKILQNANIAMSNAKTKGGNKVAYFTRELKISSQIKSNLENSLRTAIEENQLKLFFQPQVDIFNVTITGAEALIRWQHPKHGLLPPNSFIPTLEETGLIHSATEWIIKNAVAYWENLINHEVIDKHSSLSINIPPSFIHLNQCRERINNIVNKFSIKKENIKLELTENAFIDINTKNLNTFVNLKEDGYKIVIDDFGTGYSSLSHLKAFPIDCIKLDRLFIKDIVNSNKDTAIAEAMIKLCQKLDMELIAEGVDTQEKLNLLKALNCKLIQGFYFSKPLSKDDFTEYLSSFTNN